MQFICDVYVMLYYSRSHMTTQCVMRKQVSKILRYCCHASCVNERLELMHCYSLFSKAYKMKTEWICRTHLHVSSPKLLASVICNEISGANFILVHIFEILPLQVIYINYKSKFINLYKQFTILSHDMKYRAC